MMARANQTLSVPSMLQVLRMEMSGGNALILAEQSYRTLVDALPWAARLLWIGHMHDTVGDIEIDIAVNGTPINHVGGAQVFSRNTLRILDLNGVVAPQFSRVSLFTYDYSETERAPDGGDGGSGGLQPIGEATLWTSTIPPTLSGGPGPGPTSPGSSPGSSPTASPTQSPTQSPTASPSPTISPTPSPTITPSPTPSPSPSPTASPGETVANFSWLLAIQRV